MKRLKEKIFFLALFCSSLASLSQDLSGLFHFERFTVSEGLPGNKVRKILQDSRGFIWLCTNGGVSRYDGRTFRHYPTNKTSFSDPNPLSVAEDADGNIWIGTESGLNRIDPFTEKVTKYFQGKGPGTIPHNYCNALYLDKQKNFWISTEKGVALYDKKTNSFAEYPVELYGNDPRINKGIACMFEDSRNRFWLATSYGMKLFDRSTMTYRTFLRQDKMHDSLAPQEFRSIAEDSRGHIWAGTFATGLYQYNESSGQFEKTEVPGVDMNQIVIEDILPLRLRDKDYLLLAPYNGVLCIEITSLAVNSYRSFIPAHSGRVEYLPEPYHASQFLLDNEKNLWWGGPKGLLKMSVERFSFHWKIFANAGKPRPFVFHIIPDIKSPASIFYLTTQHGWWKYDEVSGTIAKYPLPVNENKLLTTINRWYPDENGYWFTSVHGMGYYDLKKNQLIDLRSIPVSMTGNAYTGHIAKDPSGKFWISLRRTGILIYDPVSKRTEQLFADTTRDETTYGKVITDLRSGPDGNIYFCVESRLYRVNPLDYSFKYFKSPAFSEPVDDGKISPYKIIFTKDNRTIVLARMRIYELKNDQLIPIYPATGLCDFIIDNVVTGYDETLWITTRNTVLKTNTSFSEWEDQASSAGIDPDDPPFEIYAALPKKIFFTGDGRLGILNETSHTETRNLSPVIISRVKYGNKELFLVSANEQRIKTSFKDAIEIEVSPFSYANSQETKILYRLEGWDKEWKELTGSSPLRYEQLPPGTYHFKTKTVSGNTTESKEAGFTFSVIPPFYRTWWFISLIVLFIGSSIFLFYRYRLQTALRMERMRTRIATDLHDDIGATLSSISMYSETLKDQVKGPLPHLEPVLNKIGENSRDMVNSMSDIVWAINPDNDDGEILVRRMEHHAKDLCSVKDVQLGFKSDPRVYDVKLTLDQRKNIYLVFKEALNNALKYSGGTLISIAITKDQNNILLEIQDNGRGFDSATNLKGNGLKNMRVRAKEINASVNIATAPDSGTTIMMRCPV